MVFLRIDPALPIVWRSPNAIQVGGETARVVLDPLSEGEERMLAAVRAGVPSHALAAIGDGPAEASAFLDRIAPALLHGERPPAPAVHVRVRSAARDDVARTVRMLGLVAAPADRRPSVGVIITDHAVPARAYRDWIREGVAHFAVVFGAESVTIGPVVRPGATGCLRCADLGRVEADAAWPAVASQLAVLPAAMALEPVARTEALCVAARLAMAVGGGGDGAEILRSWRRMGGRVGVEVAPHDECCAIDLQRPIAG